MKGRKVAAKSILGAQAALQRVVGGGAAGKQCCGKFAGFLKICRDDYFIVSDTIMTFCTGVASSVVMSGEEEKGTVESVTVQESAPVASFSADVMSGEEEQKCAVEESASVVQEIFAHIPVASFAAVEESASIVQEVFAHMPVATSFAGLMSAGEEEKGTNDDTSTVVADCKFDIAVGRNCFAVLLVEFEAASNLIACFCLCCL
jgi:hypothetical protein